MSLPKKRKLGEFSKSKGDKDTAKIEETLLELKKDYDVQGFEYEYENNELTGMMRCTGVCLNKNSAFSAKGGRRILNPDRG